MTDYYEQLLKKISWEPTARKPENGKCENIAEAFLRRVRNIDNLKCAHIAIDRYDREICDSITHEYFLKCGFDNAELMDFLDKIDVYEDHVSIVNSDGYIWFNNGLCLTRREYKCSVWWSHYDMPIPDECINEIA